MDVLLINSPLYKERNSSAYQTTAPLGLGYLATSLRRQGYSTEIVDAESEKLSFEEIIMRAKKINPSVVGINAFSTNFEYAKEILSAIPSEYKLIGGPHITLSKDFNLNEGITYVTGEADFKIIDLVRDRPKGIIHAGNIQNLDDLPFIDRDLFLNDPYFVGEKREASISGSRGCNYHCSYCSVPNISGKLRSRSVENILEEIKQLSSKKVNSIHFIDDLFNSSKDRVENFAKQLIDSDLEISWRALCRIEGLDETLLGQMKESGCYKLAFGVESASPKILEYIGKDKDPDKARKVFDNCKKFGIQTKGFFTIGYPDETLEEMRKTINFAKDLNPDEVRFMVVRAFPNTPLYEDMKRRGFDEKKLKEYRQFQGEQAYMKYHVMNIQSLNGMNPSELDNLIREAYELFK